ncbi:MAG: cytochrome c3 family protein [Coriobacteriia bacterium]|nr:cytochrome c3 family protein [Coriobacteriia bacterium]
MKKTFVVLALACALVLSFSAIAGANEWKGFSPLNPDAPGTPGFVAWDDARANMAANNVPAALQATAHGGYVASTTKCAVCHSLHRATGIPDGAPAPNNQLFLTSGGDSCTACHTDWGSMTTSKLVEWAVNGVGAGPHDTVGACVACHTGGIHGGNGSDYHVMNVFMLGGNADAQIAAEFNVAGQNRGTGTAAGNWDANRAVFDGTLDGSGNDGTRWWALGTTTPVGMGGLPAGVSAIQFAAARSVATGATCGLAGCHTYSAFANNIWGTGFTRVDPSDPASTTVVTGHAVPALGTTSGTNNGGCGPCHPGNAAGLPTWSRNTQWRQFGCNQCHDMVGVATNSIAFPHGNRNIEVFEWIDNRPAQNSVEITTTNIQAGNLWMYSGNLARAAGAGAVNNVPRGENNAPLTVVNSSPGSFADANWRVLTGVTSGALVPGTTGMNDGACLKCHLATDALSLNNTGVGAFIGAQGYSDFATRGHGFNAGRYPGGASSMSDTQAGGSFRMHLYR